MKHVNNVHNTIKLTLETEPKEGLPFLDLAFNIIDNGIDKELFRKPTHTEKNH